MISLFSGMPQTLEKTGNNMRHDYPLTTTIG